MSTPIVIALLFVVAAFVLKAFRAHIKGWFGETVLNTLLKVKLDGTKYRILHNIMLPTDDGTTTQIDHVIVSEWGIFVIETKTYSGWVFGDAKSPQWTVTHFKRKDRFQNPLRQNYKHLATLSECLGIPMEYFKTIVAFGGETTFKTTMPEEVMLFGDVPNYILRNSTNAIIKAEQVPEVVDAILEWQGTLTHRQKADHIKNLKARHEQPPEAAVAAVSSSAGSAKPDSVPTCPKCGASMVRRTRQSDGGAFWGCSNYPKCRGIRT
jgi:hypothetical protein